ncbi:DUF3192 domain-containing protein [Shewanella sp. NKUCC05_KAH]|jgi:hypothetical protein|uniref:DUF3192 domain-containing protein n=1 Tax=Shewanella TaxID=22 RepID=UPI000DE9E947|nr:MULTISPECIES: DUF3192 domain-containing protein [unclassified Shewanella]RBP76761.1 uncharacterized protein DUF3192 [Shewanella putrefaciens]MBI1673405.1 DUF3192 domain-containing protein [Shewanella sp. DW31]MBW3526528.1 DUF3192 domain-containing protein [Shewanella sp. NKUCC05_KAH]MCU8006528.1 DUF3192 domain-containing protein [Shewanella sp. SM87]MCU8059723.1 DUF3192 domain-containing protein [Shewanella sp. SM55]
MKSKVSVIIGSIFAAYVAFVAVVVLVYEPTPDDMSWEDRQSYNSQKMNELALGQNIVSVKQLLGKADFSEAKAVKETKLQVLFYRTHHEKSDGVTTKEECTPLIFKNDQLIAWGQDTYKQYLDADTDTALSSAQETLTSK